MRFLVLGKKETGEGVHKRLDSLNIEHDYLLTSEVKDFNYDYVIKSPGIKPDNEVIKKLILNNSKIISDIELSYALFPEKFYLAVTGTNGKTTTVKILEEILKSKNFKSCGNIGNSIMLEEENNLIVECSSFQLKYIDWFKPNIAIILNIDKAHLDYHLSYENYITDKLKITKNMKRNIIIYNYDDEILKDKLKDHDNSLTFSLNNQTVDCYIKKNYIYYKNKKYLDIKELNLKNEYNLKNFMASILAAKALNIDDEIIKDTIKKFKGIKFRLEKINDFIFNDAKSTNPASTLAALKSFSSDNEILLISGGKDRDEDFNILKSNISIIKKIYAYGETKDKIKLFFKNENVKVVKYQKLSSAIKKAYQERKNEIILFSPMCASWDQYNNYEERGYEFEETIKKLINNGYN